MDHQTPSTAGSPAGSGAAHLRAAAAAPDGPDASAHVGWSGLVARVKSLLAWWQRSEGTLSVHTIVTARRERFYWGTVLLTFGLGTALGDTTAIDFHMGFVWSVALFGGLILVPLVAWRMGANAVICFWIAYSLTRPLGASIADGLAVTHAKGGLGWGTGPVTAVGLLLFAVLVAYVALTHSDEEGAHAAHELARPAHYLESSPDLAGD